MDLMKSNQDSCEGKREMIFHYECKEKRDGMWRNP